MMSEHRKEQVSAMADGELGGDFHSACNDLLQTPSLKDCWARYHLIRDSLQQHLPETVDTGLAARISACIQNEPTILAPRSNAKNAILKPLAGFAIAASVAAMAILGIQQNRQGMDIRNPQTVSFTLPSKMNSIPVQQASLNTQTEAQLRQVRATTRARLNSYLVNYNEYRTNSGLQGMLPYARTVTFENNK